MLKLRLDHADPPIDHVLCVGAHCDDLEIGCGGTILRLLEQDRPPAITWVVFSSNEARRQEALDSARRLLDGLKGVEIVVHSFRDGFFPSQQAAIKDCFEGLKQTVAPDLILTHQRNDFHQDHRVISELTWNTFRNHLILEYEIPKYDGDLGTPNVYMPVSEEIAREKVRLVLDAFESQTEKHWFDEQLFLGLMRVRGMEGRSPTGYAEAFTCRKLSLLIE
jgi:LmbE family N-acetylglucosaminyl deacetylase